METRSRWMHLKLSKNERISDWEIRVISGVSFMLSTMLVYWLIYLTYPEGYRLGPYATLECGLSAAIVGGYFGPGIFKAAFKEKLLFKLLKFVSLIFICETIISAFLFALLGLFAGFSFYHVSIVFFGMFFRILVFYGVWKIIQIIITVSILFLGFRYIRAREPRE